MQRAILMSRSIIAGLLTVLCLTPVQAETPDSEAFVAAFGEVCIPERLSYRGTLDLAEALGWRAVVRGENADYDRFIAHAAGLMEQETAEDPDFVQGAGNAWFTREIGGRSHLLAVSYLLTEFLDTVGCHLYDFGATAPLDPEAVTRLIGQPLAYSTDAKPGSEHYNEFRVADPEEVIVMTWGPSPALPRTLDTNMTFIPQDSTVAARAGFTGVTLTFSTSLPDRKEWQE